MDVNDSRAKYITKRNNGKNLSMLNERASITVYKSEDGGLYRK